MAAYIDPKYGPGVRAKYVFDIGTERVTCRFGITAGDPCIVRFTGSAADETFLSSQSDTLLVPPLDNTIGNTTVRDMVRSAVESFSLPAQWVVVGMSYRTILRELVCMSNIMQGMRGQGMPTTLQGQLDKTLSQFSQAIRDALGAACVPPYQPVAYDISSITGSTTLRAALAIVGQQAASTPQPFLLE